MPFSPMHYSDLSAHFTGEELDAETLLQIRSQRLATLTRPHWQPTLDLLKRLEDRDLFSFSPTIEFSQAVLSIGRAAEVSEEGRSVLREIVQRLVPWRKGPFSLFGLEIDAEWRSDKKWARLAPHLGPLTGKRILDVGCSNGYYMFRAAAQNPRQVVGIDPCERSFLSFQMLQRFANDSRLDFELLGLKELDLFRNCFDLVLCLGIVYHQRNPLEALEILKGTMLPGGKILVESMAIPGEDSVALFAPDRYAKARNVYFIPTANCIASWMERVGFVDVQVVSSVKLTSEEQRRTELAPYESLEDFLDPSDPSKTLEGYPAPLRVAVSGVKSS